MRAYVLQEPSYTSGSIPNGNSLRVQGFCGHYSPLTGISVTENRQQRPNTSSLREFGSFLIEMDSQSDVWTNLCEHDAIVAFHRKL